MPVSLHFLSMQGYRHRVQSRRVVAADTSIGFPTSLFRLPNGCNMRRALRRQRKRLVLSAISRSSQMRRAYFAFQARRTLNLTLQETLNLLQGQR
jgi:hypothetical protein